MPGEQGAGRSPTGSAPRSPPTAPRPRATTSSPSRRSSRARTCAGSSEAFDARRARRLRATHRRRARLGRRPRRRRPRPLARRGGRRGARRLYRGAPASSTRRSTRASACRCWRRWRAAPRSSPRGRRSTSSRTGSPSGSTRSTPGRSRRASRRPSSGATSWARWGRSAPPATPGSAPRASTCASTVRRAVSEPLVIIDADVLGRQRTGDESYVAEPPARAPAVRGRLAARRRDARPDLVPDGVEPIALPARSQPLRMAIRLPLLLRRAATSRSRTSCTSSRPPSAALGPHGPGPVLRALPGADEPQRPLLLPHVRPPLGPARGPRADRLGVDEARPRRALRRSRPSGSW